MKKNISINIGGIIFHIEEDGYEKLRNYLDSVNSYFSTFEDSKEIIDDIEGRIAEIFLSKLDEGKQIITPEDVDDLISTMGTTRDFEASIEAEEEPSSSSEPEKEATTEEDSSDNQTKDNTRKPKRLYRDTRRKVVGGVAAGIANYARIDPIWVRLIMLAFLFNIFFWGLSGAVVVAYLILWIVVPANDSLEEDKKLKKLFRSTDDRVLGGVSGGIASYFGADPVLIRVLFVISIFLGGAGILAYLILWIITPEAKSITEKMQMQGEPVTLSNIEDNLKRNLNVKEGEESVFVKILLFPFRLIALVFNAVADFAGPFLRFLVEAVRVAFGALLTIMGFLLMLSFTFTLAVLLGIGGSLDSIVNIDGFAADQLVNTFSTIALISSYLVLMVPSLALSLLGLVIILKKRVATATVGWTLFGLWIIGMIGVAVSIPGIIRDYSMENTYYEDRTFPPTAGIAELKLDEKEWDGYESVELRIRGHEDSVYLLNMEFESRGSTRTNARENAEAVDYGLRQEGNAFYFDSEISFDNAPFRFQELNATFYVPYGQVFKMDRSLGDIMINSLWMYEYNVDDLGENEWVFDSTGLKCITCSNRGTKEATKGKGQTYGFENFDEIKLVSMLDYEITRGNDYSVRLEGDEADLEDVYLSQNGDELEIRFGTNDDWWKSRKGKEKVRVFITLPDLEYISATGACEGDVRGFEQSVIEIEIAGATKMWADVTARRIEANIVGASELTLVGSGDDLNVNVIGASNIDAFDYIVDDADITAIGASSAKVYVKKDLNATATGASKIRFRGDADLYSDTSGFSSVKKD